MRNRRRAEARGRALALTQGILAPVGWWRPAAWLQFKSQLPKWMGFQLENWQDQGIGQISLPGFVAAVCSWQRGIASSV
jgi:hypothetical protein